LEHQQHIFVFPYTKLILVIRLFDVGTGKLLSDILGVELGLKGKKREGDYTVWFKNSKVVQ
jgi:hypothetical protein